MRCAVTDQVRRTDAVREGPERAGLVLEPPDKRLALDLLVEDFELGLEAVPVDVVAWKGGRQSARVSDPGEHCLWTFEDVGDEHVEAQLLGEPVGHELGAGHAQAKEVSATAHKGRCQMLC